MRYEYTILFSSELNRWQVAWSEFEDDLYGKIRGDVENCETFDEALAIVRRFVTRYEPERVAEK